MKSRLKEFVRWSLLRGALLFFFFSLGLGAALLVGMQWQTSTLAEGLSDARHQLDELEQSYRLEHESAVLAKQYGARYRELEVSHFLGIQDRLTLVETLRQLHTELDLPRLLFRFEPSRPLIAYRGLSLEHHRLLGTDHILDFSLRDETELLTLFNRLNAAGQGLFTVEKCSLMRRDKRLYLDKPGNLSGQCRLRWYSLQALNEGDANAI